jgi:glutamate-1-semialdehyde 2,1-aminomutase
VNRVGSMITVFFSAEPVFDAASARKADTKKFARYFRAMLENGVYLPPSQFEAAFLSVAHTDDDVDATVAASRKAFAEAVLA